MPAPRPTPEKPLDDNRKIIMTKPTLCFDKAPEISDQAAHDILGFLYDLMTAFENKYYAQLKRYDQQREDEWQEPKMQFLDKQQNLFAALDDDSPDF
jgi:hypothetical protein